MDSPRATERADQTPRRLRPPAQDMGGNSNWMYLAVQNATAGHVSLALWLLYEAATEPLVDPLSSAGEIQVGFFNQSKNLNRQVPLFELAEESKPCLELASGEAATLKATFAAWIFRGRVAAPPRPPRKYSADGRRRYGVAAIWLQLRRRSGTRRT